MKQPLIRDRGRMQQRGAERGVTIVLVALAMTAIMGMAALSIDVVTLYLANAEAQRSADAAALAAARIISLSGITGDPGNSSVQWAKICGASATATATQVAKEVGGQNTVAGVSIPPGQVTVTYGTKGGGWVSDCSAVADPAFGVNPLVRVKVQRTDVPTFFARIWGRRGASVSATATAEAFNSSGSAAYSAGGIIPVHPRCVKPWIVPNIDPGDGSCSGSGGGGGGDGGGNGNGGEPDKPPPPCKAFVDNSDGTIQSPGIGGSGVIGRTFNLFADCTGTTEPCGLQGGQPPTANAGGVAKANLQYVPGEIPLSFTAVPSSCSVGGVTTLYEQAVAGCDQTTVYQCGVENDKAAKPNRVDLGENPAGPSGDTASAVQCLINQGSQDSLVTTSFPYQIQAGSGNPTGLSGSVVTSSNSIVSLPIYDQADTINDNGGTTPVTIIGFLQVFLKQVNTDASGSVSVTVLNVTGCGSGTNPTGNAVAGSSPVPVRLIKSP